MISDEPRPLWEGYGQPGATRRPSEVCVTERIGEALALAVALMRPRVVVEAGTGFGVSAGHLTAGLERSGRGHLYTFEAHEAWAREARRYLDEHRHRVTVLVGRFEERLSDALAGRTIDLAFLDAIHADDAVRGQWCAVMAHRSPRVVVAIDDVQAVPGAWQEIAGASRPLAVIDGRLGIVEVTG